MCGAAQGLCQMAGEHFRDRAAVVRLWVHECERVLSDRLVSDADIAKFREFRINATRKYFDDVPQVTRDYDLDVKRSSP